MGVPKFFSWITARYKECVVDALTEEDFEYFR
jgi:5'-3' exonuclease